VREKLDYLRLYAMGTALQSSGRGVLVTVGRKAMEGCGLLRLWLRTCSMLVVKNQEGRG
jgi:hypothetical protein